LIVAAPEMLNKITQRMIDQKILIPPPRPNLPAAYYARASAAHPPRTQQDSFRGRKCRSSFAASRLRVRKEEIWVHAKARRTEMPTRLAMSIFLNIMFPCIRHCEERSDAAIQNGRHRTGLPRFARNDEVVGD
jgi:hypothetical protein